MRSFDWELLPYFLAVARTGSLRAAASTINASYGTVNRNIQALEASYGVRLFHRSKRGFALTEFGEALLPVVEDAEQTILAARKKVEGLDRSESGTIRFSLSPTLAYDFVAPIIGRFHEKYPKIDIEFHLTSEVESITNDETDVSLRAAESVVDDVVARKLFRLILGVYASETYVQNVFPNSGRQGEGLSWIGLADENWRPPPMFQMAQMRHRVSDGYMRACLLNQHCGMSPMPTIFESSFPNLRRVPGTDLSKGPWLWILLHSDLQKTVRVRRFVDFLAEELLSLKRAL
ncbi:LysR family transcriptional regulator [Nitratireductor sp. XY-223]|uniref:LysR family transcriptional regulator n=1 Tax=Nitratireductor sp. XY-223 TaxID=2561926 RepID=UPI0010AACF65|nr:LysR family transcriptional regulator [Nitratireductor sp. XY-223]